MNSLIAETLGRVYEVRIKENLIVTAQILIVNDKIQAFTVSLRRFVTSCQGDTKIRKQVIQSEKSTQKFGSY
jgi:hypothetical protein